MSQGEFSRHEESRNQFEWLLQPEVAAFRCGRLVNQIQNMTTVLWIIGGDIPVIFELGVGPYMSSQIPWSELRLASRGAICSSEQQRIAFAAKIDQMKVDWNNVYRCLWHGTVLYEHNLQIEIDRQRSLQLEEAPSVAMMIEARCRELLQSIVNPINDGLLEFFQDTLGSRELEFFCLGQHVDRLVYPVPAYQVITQEDSNWKQSNPFTTKVAAGELQSWNTAELLTDESGSQNVQSIAPEGVPWRLPKLHSPSVLPSVEWARELQCRSVSCRIDPRVYQQYLEHQWDESHDVYGQATFIADSIEAGVMTGLLPRAECPYPQAQGVVSHSRSDTRTIGTLDQGAEPIVDPPEAGVEWLRVKSGLEFCKGTLQVRVIDSNEAVDVPSKLRFNLLLQLAQKGRKFTSRIELEEEWERLGGRDVGGKSIDSQLTRIRRVLEKFGKTLRNSPSIGWRIEDK